MVYHWHEWKLFLSNHCEETVAQMQNMQFMCDCSNITSYVEIWSGNIGIQIIQENNKENLNTC